MRRLHHFILTNFNITVPGWTTDSSGAEVLTRSWLDYRIDLFETFCFPSVAGQTCQRFEWLVRFAPDSPPDLKDRIARWQNLVHLTPLWDHASMQATIRARVGSDASLVLTTRIDNDDGMHRDFVSVIQREIGESAEVLSPAHGYSLKYPEGELRLVRALRPPAFITLVDPVTGPPTRSVLSAQHREAASLAPVREIGAFPLWLRVSHGRNIWNKPGGEPCSTEGVREAFSLGPDVILKEPQG
jgi:hypothetical protein